MIRIGSDTDIGMNRNSFDWLGMNSYPILLPGKPSRLPIDLLVQIWTLENFDFLLNLYFIVDQ